MYIDDRSQFVLHELSDSIQIVLAVCENRCSAVLFLSTHVLNY